MNYLRISSLMVLHAVLMGRQATIVSSFSLQAACYSYGGFGSTPHFQNRQLAVVRKGRRTIRSNFQICLKSQEHNNSAIDDSQQSKKELPLLGSLEVLAIVVSLFFTATVFLTGDVLLATPSTTPQTKINADEMLQSDFSKIETSVHFQ
jgi:hypothetical protein